MLLLPLLLSLSALSQVGQIQQIKIVNFTVKNQLPPVIDSWNNIPGSLLLVAQKPPTIRVEGVRLVLQIRSNGTMICGSNANNGLPVDNFTTRTFTVNELSGLLAGCHELRDGSYTICAQFFNIDKVAISNEVCKDFTVETPRETDYAPPTLIVPENGKEYSSLEMRKPVMFRWTSLVPKPREPVTYRLRVWQLMQGQSGSMAMRTNQAVVTKDVDNITQAVVNNIYNGPCKPPYLCDFIWSVQAINREGHPLGRNEGNSEPYTFKIYDNSGEGINYDPPKLTFPEDGKLYAPKDMSSPIMFRWKPITPIQQEPVNYRIKVWQLMQGQSASMAMKTNQPIVTKEVGNLTQVELSRIWNGPCKPPYLCDYVWQVEALDREGHPMCSNEGKSDVSSFNVADNGLAAAQYEPPKLISPEEKKSFNPKELSRVITFKWTPVTPGPTYPVTYRMKVWQLMQGQSGSQAMTANQPIVTKDVVNLTQVDVSNLWTGPCKPPYLCAYVWQVQALDPKGNPVGSNEGKSEYWNFIAQNNVDIQIDSLFVSCCENGQQNIYIKVRNNLANAVNIVAITYKINGVGAAIPLTPISPSLPTYMPGNGIQVFTSTIKCIAAKTLKFLVDAVDVADPDNKETEVATDTLTCCYACDTTHIDIVQTDLSFDTSGNIVLNTNISVTPNQVSSIKAELVYFEYKPGDDGCILCNKDSKAYGNFSNGTHTQLWSFTPPANLNGGIPAPMTITVPPTVNCCDVTIRWCIRYVVTFADCTVCNKLVCYELIKQGCNANPNAHKKN